MKTRVKKWNDLSNIPEVNRRRILRRSIFFVGSSYDDLESCSDVGEVGQGRGAAAPKSHDLGSPLQVRIPWEPTPGHTRKIGAPPFRRACLDSCTREYAKVAPDLHRRTVHQHHPTGACRLHFFIALPEALGPAPKKKAHKALAFVCRFHKSADKVLDCRT